MKKNKTTTAVISILILICSIQLTRIENTISISISIPNSNLKSNSNVLLDTFPVDLGLLFWEDNLDNQSIWLNAIGNSSAGWMLTPWGGHFISNHLEGADKFYFYPNRHIEVRMPINGSFIPELRVGIGSSKTIDSNDVIVDVGLDINIGDNCHILFGHLCLLQTIYDEIDTNGAYYFEENELIGYTMDEWALDYYYYNETNVICPYDAFTPTLKTQVDYYFNLQYERAKLSGLHPEGRLSNSLIIDTPNTIWGTWEYIDGPYNGDVKDNPPAYEVGLQLFLHKDHATSETYWKNPLNHSRNLTENDLGHFGDGNGGSVAGYDKIGESLIMQVEGDDTNGILELRTIGYHDWGPANTSVYTRYELTVNETDFKKDILEIEHFSDLVTAQSGFTSDKLTYQRYLRFYPYVNPYAPPTETPTPTNSTTDEGIIYGSFLRLSIVIGIVTSVIIIVRRRKI